MRENMMAERQQKNKTDNGMAKVSVVCCSEYDREKMITALDRVWDDIIGDRDFIGKGTKVLLKPNLLTATEPARAVTTHPLLVEVVVEKCKGLGAEVAVGDSPGVGIHNLEELWEITGMAGVAERTGAKLVNVDAAGSTSYPVDNSVISELQISDVIKQYDIIINLPKLKTHTLTLMTGAKKNLFGLVPGGVKADVHRRAPKGKLMANALLALEQVISSSLTIMDAIEGHEGNGPLNGTPVKLGYLLASRFNLAVDITAARLVGIQPARVPMIALACADTPLEPEVCGDGLPAQPLPFKTPGTYALDMLPAFLLKMVSQWATLTPVFSKTGCQRCGVCVKACPVDALKLSKQGVDIDKKKCISCFCCQELCTYGAVELKASWLGSLFFNDTRKKDEVIEGSRKQGVK